MASAISINTTDACKVLRLIEALPFDQLEYNEQAEIAGALTSGFKLRRTHTGYTLLPQDWAVKVIERISAAHPAERNDDEQNVDGR